MNYAETLDAAIALHEAGRLAEAETGYRAVLARDPDQPQALRRMAILAVQRGEHLIAIQLLNRAIAADPDAIAARFDLIRLLGDLGRFEDSAAASREALQIFPEHPGLWMSLACALHALRHLSQAIEAYQRCLALDPSLVEVHFNIANAFCESGQMENALHSYTQALKLDPEFAPALTNFATTLLGAGRYHEALRQFQKALSLAPRDPAAHNNFGVALQKIGQYAEAASSHHEALRLEPRFADAHNNLGAALRALGRLDEAASSFQQAIECNPNFSEACLGLSLVLLARRRVDEAVALAHKAVTLHADSAIAWAGLGDALQAAGKLRESIDAYDRAVSLGGRTAAIYNNLANALQADNRPDEAISACHSALEIAPGDADALNNLGNCYKSLGNLREAIACYKRAIAARPDSAELRSNLIIALNTDPGCDAQQVLAECLAWSEACERPLRHSIVPSQNNLSPERPLRVGYLSPYLCDHVIGHNVLPLVRLHDRSQFKVVCYSDAAYEDDFTRRFRSLAEWRRTAGLTHEEVAEMVREDQIDILVDLTLHLADNRLLVFARKPAPVQVTFAGYPGGTGLEAMDFRLTDPWLDPPEATDRDYRERSFRLPHSFWCYDPEAMMAGFADEPPVGSLPAFENGLVTFGCLNSYAKINPLTLHLWAEVLHAVEHSRLLLLAPKTAFRQRVRDWLGEVDIKSDRIDFATPCTRKEYLAIYRRIDIGLDTLPYNGHTTSLDSFWMGVPVVTRIGRTVVGRAGLSQCANLDLRELVARSDEEFVQIASGLARDLSRLAGLRSKLRERMRLSPLCDSAGFARAVESAYRQVWREYCSR